MNRKNLMVSAVVSIIVYCLHSCSPEETKHPATTDTLAVKDSLIKRGGYLVSIVGCDECHSPKIMTATGLEIDSARRFSGYPSAEPVRRPHVTGAHLGQFVANSDLTMFQAPFGVSFAANITSDATGIGDWSEARFRNAFVNGQHLGLDKERHIVPPMSQFTKMKDADVKAIFMYLKSTKPVKNIVPAWIPPAK